MAYFCKIGVVFSGCGLNPRLLREGSKGEQNKIPVCLKPLRFQFLPSSISCLLRLQGIMRAKEVTWKRRSSLSET